MVVRYAAAIVAASRKTGATPPRRSRMLAKLWRPSSPSTGKAGGRVLDVTQAVIRTNAESRIRLRQWIRREASTRCIPGARSGPASAGLFSSQVLPYQLCRGSILFPAMQGAAKGVHALGDQGHQGAVGCFTKGIRT